MMKGNIILPIKVKYKVHYTARGTLGKDNNGWTTLWKMMCYVKIDDIMGYRLGGQTSPVGRSPSRAMGLLSCRLQEPIDWRPPLPVCTRPP